MAPCPVLMAAMADCIADAGPAGLTVMALRDNLREWRVNDAVYCWPLPGGDAQAFCIQDVSWAFYCSLRALGRNGTITVAAATAAAVASDPHGYNPLQNQTRYVPLNCVHVKFVQKK